MLLLNQSIESYKRNPSFRKIMMIAEGIHRLPTPVLMRHWREMLNHLVKSDFDHHAHHTRLMILIILICLSMAGDIHAQVSPEEHA